MPDALLLILAAVKQIFYATSKAFTSNLKPNLSIMLSHSLHSSPRLLHQPFPVEQEYF